MLGYLRTIYIQEPTYYLREAQKTMRRMYNVSISTSMLHYIRCKYLQFFRKRCTLLSRNRKQQRVIQAR